MTSGINKVSDYIQAMNICREALHDFRMNIDDYLPEYKPENNNVDKWKDMYLYHWNVDSIQEVYNIFLRAAQRILSTVMANHISYEIHCCDKSFRNAIGNKSITEGQAAFCDAMRIFGDLAYVIRLLEKVKIT